MLAVALKKLYIMSTESKVTITFNPIQNKVDHKQLPLSYFKDKWYIREDLYPESFSPSRSVHNCNIMKEIGNCFDTKGQALDKANEIRKLLGVTTV